jgi:prepilin-type N-terminal cleavage/methylation domain-containing protein
MKGLTGLNTTESSRGFTLIEMLLALILIMMFLGAIVFSLSNLQQCAQLDEGAAQVENLLKFARAHAANIGRQVQLGSEEEADPEFDLPSGNLALNWEPDPLGQPGTLEKVNEAAGFLESINELVQIESIRVLDSDNPDASVNSGETDFDLGEEYDTGAAALSAITFYPDGSSDSAEIVLCSRSADDPRRVVIQWSGITGSIRRGLVTNANDQTEVSEPTSPPAPKESGMVEPP